MINGIYNDTPKSKIETVYHEVECKSALNKTKTDRFHFGYTLNVYRGCIHSCPYCYARYTHPYLGFEKANDFDKFIFVKTNIKERLEKELSSKNWNRDLVSLGTATDPYQPIEKKYKLVRKCLRLLADYHTPVIFSTKSDLVTRDLDILSEINTKSLAAVAITLTTADDSMRKLFEPRASSIKRRIKALMEIKKSGVKTGLHLLPIMKYINDTSESISEVIRIAKECDVDYFIYGGLNTKSPVVRVNLLDAVKRYDPAIHSIYQREFNKNTFNNKRYTDYIDKLVKNEMKKHNLKPASLNDIMRKAYINMRHENKNRQKKKTELQLSLF
jgi:DNA repair photolyase